MATPAPSKEQKAKQDAEFQNELKNLPERKRRTFLRYLEKQQKGIVCSEEGKEGEEPKQFTEEEILANARTKLQAFKEHLAKNSDDDFDQDFDDFNLDDSDESQEDED